MQTKNATQKSFYFKVWGLAAKLSPPQSLLLPCFLHFCIQPWKSVSLNSFTRRKQEQVFLSQGGRAVCLHLATDMRGWPSSLKDTPFGRARWSISGDVSCLNSCLFSEVPHLYGAGPEPPQPQKRFFSWTPVTEFLMSTQFSLALVILTKAAERLTKPCYLFVSSAKIPVLRSRSPVPWSARASQLLSLQECRSSSSQEKKNKTKNYRWAGTSVFQVALVQRSNNWKGINSFLLAHHTGLSSVFYG